LYFVDRVVVLNDFIYQTGGNIPSLPPSGRASFLLTIRAKIQWRGRQLGRRRDRGHTVAGSGRTGRGRGVWEAPRGRGGLEAWWSINFQSGRPQAGGDLGRSSKWSSTCYSATSPLCPGLLVLGLQGMVLRPNTNGWCELPWAATRALAYAALAAALPLLPPDCTWFLLSFLLIWWICIVLIHCWRVRGTWENVCSKVTFIFVSHGACVGVLDQQTY
jgi:hypothetical protein